MIAVDDHGKIVLANAQAEKLFGYERDELLGMTMEMLVPERFRRSHAAHRQDFGHHSRARPMGMGLDLVALRKDGTELPVEISLGPMETPQGALVMAAVRDVTEQRKARDFLKKAQAELEAKVEERTEELRSLNQSLVHEISERRRLEDEILTIGEEEKQRIGQDLHDDLGQNLLGIALMAKLLEDRSKGQPQGEAKTAGEIARRANEAIQKTRDLARGLFPVTVQTGGLPGALQELVGRIAEHSGVDCILKEEASIEGEHFEDEQVPLQLFRIAQEALNNAVKHAKAKKIVMRLRRVDNGLELSVADDGVGIPEAVGDAGMGLKVMHYRAARIGAALEIRRREGGGTSVICRVPRV